MGARGGFAISANKHLIVANHDEDHSRGAGLEDKSVPRSPIDSMPGSEEREMLLRSRMREEQQQSRKATNVAAV